MKRSGSYSSALDDVGIGCEKLSTSDQMSAGDRLSIGDRLSLGGSHCPTPTSGYTNGSVYTINLETSKPNSRTITPSIGRSTADLIAPIPSSEDKLDFTDPERASWDNKFQYLLSAIGLAVGLGNVWRFPYLAQKNGGGAFLLPYIIMLFLEGLPIFYMELAMGQRMRNGPIGTWSQISPYLGGIGVACVMVSYIVGIYYNTIIAWCLYYLVQSFRSELLWSTCPIIPVPGAPYKNMTQPVKECELAGPTAYFWYRSTLDVSSSIEENGHMLWHLELSILCAWIIVFFCMINGIASSGKVVYFTATFPYVVLVIFFFRGVTLKNFHVGLVHMFLPKFDRLSDPQVWLEAANQIFYSLGLAFGGLMAMSSYNPVNNNCLKDAYTVVFINCGTSVFAGIVIFSILGFKASASYDRCLESTVEAGKNLTCDLQNELESTASGPGLAFIAFTEAINQFPAPPIWAILFFLMLLTLGLDSMFGSLECVTTCVMDSGRFPDLQKKKFVVPAFLCLTSFLISLCFATQSGSYIFLLFDEFTGGFPLMVIALFEIISVSYIHGLHRFAEDVELMVGTRPNYYWLLMWKYISPLVIIIILSASIIKMLIQGVTYEVWDKETATKIDRPWPGWSLFVASLLIIAILIWIPLIYIVKRFNLTGWKKTPAKYFPRDELRREKNLKPYILKDWEKKYLFIFEGCT